MLNPTDEQRLAVDNAVDGKNLSINAGPGTGKTTLAKIIASKLLNKKGAYLAFNESTAKSAQGHFPHNFAVKTANALALSQMSKFMHGREIKTLNGYQIASILDLSPMPFGPPATYGYFIGQTLFNYCNSADRNMMMGHVPHLGKENHSDEFKMMIAQSAADLFCQIADPDSSLPVGHNVYMKLWQLSEPKLGLDSIILEEAQDTNPVLWDVIKNQDSQLMLIGDQYQQINEWRGGMNVMSMLPGSVELKLTKSFRFGPELAQVANCILSGHFASKFRLQGNPQIKTVLGSLNDVNYHLNIFRTNSGLVSDLMDPKNENKKIHINGNIRELKNLVNQCSMLKEGRVVNTGELARFKSWDDAYNHSKTKEGSHLMKIFGMVKNHDAYKLKQALENAENVSLRNADAVYTTAHRCKGMQAKSVRVGGDFISPRSEKWQESESNLVFVAITRAQEFLDESLVRKAIQTPSLKAVEYMQTLKGKQEAVEVKVDKQIDKTPAEVVQEIDFGQVANSSMRPF